MTPRSSPVNGSVPPVLVDVSVEGLGLAEELLDTPFVPDPFVCVVVVVLYCTSFGVAARAAPTPSASSATAPMIASRKRIRKCAAALTSRTIAIAPGGATSGRTGTPTPLVVVRRSRVGPTLEA